MNFNTYCAFWFSVDLGITDPHVPVEVFLRECFLTPEKVGWRKKTDTQKLRKFHFMTSLFNFFQLIHKLSTFFGFCLENEKFFPHLLKFIGKRRFTSVTSENG